jgi:cysteinyl-tRNA synthetase
MSLRVYNTLTRQKELFATVTPGKVGIYLCGPTVYKPPHIGHMVGPVVFDAVKRYLKYKGYDVTWVINITDVDDKLIEAAARLKIPVQELADKFTAEYLDCLNQFGINSVDRFPKASEHMAEIVELSQRLIAAGFAYAAGGNVWFDVAKDPDYGKLSNRKVEDQEAGLRELEGQGKKNAADFALWKSAKPGEPAWDSPWGKGRPGWHIECSAMSQKYLGETLDIHGGGMDLMFPHHENELAQSESATGKPLAKYWMHNGLTRIKTKLAGGEWTQEKMSGSLGNVVSAQELLNTHGSELLRYMLLSTHYRRPIEFTDEVLANTRKAMLVFSRLIERIERLTGKPLPDDAPDMDRAAAKLLESEVGPFARQVLGEKMRFLEMMDDDFNTAGAISVLHDLAGAVNSFLEQNRAEANRQPDVLEAAAAAAQTLRSLGQLLGLFRSDFRRPESHEPVLVDQLMELLIKIRNDARQTKDFQLADAVRNGLKQVGVTLEDRPDGTGWRKDWRPFPHIFSGRPQVAVDSGKFSNRRKTRFDKPSPGTPPPFIIHNSAFSIASPFVSRILCPAKTPSLRCFHRAIGLSIKNHEADATPTLIPVSRKK